MSKANYNLIDFTDQQSLAIQLADDITSQVESSIEESGLAVVALSGGSTPKPLFQELSRREVDWSKVVVTLVDERCVGRDNELSNATMMANYLLDHLPHKPIFVSLYEEGLGDVDQLAQTLLRYCHATQSTTESPATFDVVVLGMGSDGHTASFFPDANNIAKLVDVNAKATLLTCESASTQVPRITWSLPMLLNAGMLALHITGDDKRVVLEQALADDNALELPIRAAIFQAVTPLNIYYAE